MEFLVTGFNPFAGLPVNPSEIVVRALAASAATGGVTSIRTTILRTEFRAAGDEIVRLIREIQPAAIICCGLAQAETCVRFETVARNLDSSPTRDNAGEIRSGQPIAPGGPATYATTLPVSRIADAFADEAIPYKFSDDAGGFVCNHVFYRASREIAQSGAPTICGFVHLPPIDAAMATSADELIAAIRICIRTVAEFCTAG